MLDFVRACNFIRVLSFQQLLLGGTKKAVIKVTNEALHQCFKLIFSHPVSIIQLNPHHKTMMDKKLH